MGTDGPRRAPQGPESYASGMQAAHRVKRKSASGQTDRLSMYPLVRLCTCTLFVPSPADQLFIRLTAGRIAVLPQSYSSSTPVLLQWYASGASDKAQMQMGPDGLRWAPMVSDGPRRAPMGPVNHTASRAPKSSSYSSLRTIPWGGGVLQLYVPPAFFDVNYTTTATR